VRLLGPEVLVVEEFLEGLAELEDGCAIGARGLQLVRGIGAQVLQLDAVRVGVRGDRRGGEVDRNAHSVPLAK
jgi:hypothetical protein